MTHFLEDFYYAVAFINQYLSISNIFVVHRFQVRNLKYLAPFSSIANCVTIVSFGIIAYYIFRDPIELEGRRAVGSLKEFPLFFGTVLFALEAIGVVSIRANGTNSHNSNGS